MISQDDTFATVDYIKDEITHNATVIGSEAGLLKDKTYYWKVVAIDAYGKPRESNQVWSFSTTDTNPNPPGYIAGWITDNTTKAGIVGRSTRSSTGDYDDARSDGYYVFSTASGSSISVTASKAGYTSLTKTVTVTAGGTTSLNFAMVSSDSSPTANFTGSPESGTAPLTVNFTNTTTGGNAPLTYAWDFDNSGSVDSTLTNPSAVYLGPGIYTVKLTATDSDSDANNLIRTSYISVCYSNANIVGSASTYTSLQSAYNAAATTNTVQGRAVTIS